MPGKRALADGASIAASDTSRRLSASPCRSAADCCRLKEVPAISRSESSSTGCAWPTTLRPAAAAQTISLNASEPPPPSLPLILRPPSNSNSDESARICSRPGRRKRPSGSSPSRSPAAPLAEASAADACARALMAEAVRCGAAAA